MQIVIGPADSAPQASPPSDRSWRAITVRNGETASARDVSRGKLPEFMTAVVERSSSPVRWVWSSTEEIYPEILAAGTEVSRCWDLGLSQRILTGAASAADGAVSYQPAVELPLAPEAPAGRVPSPRVNPDQTSLFDSPTDSSGPQVPTADDLAREYLTQDRAVTESQDSRRLRLLLAGESQGTLIAAEIHHHGLPWNAEVHERLLEDTLGPRPASDQRPPKMQNLAERIADLLGSDRLNPDSPQDLLRAMNSAGISVKSTRKWELLDWAGHGGTQTEQRRALIAPILEYKQLYRLWTANGWHWLEEWVKDGRFHAKYIVGGVVTGRWAAHGGGAMQIPKTVRDAVRADPGNVLTVADASQVEPRILAAMSGDRALAVAGQGQDLYVGIAEIGRRAGSALKDRQAAKIALLGAMYGATSGDAGALVPHLRRLFPSAIEFVERAAATGERGGQVRTWLGRTSPLPDDAWFAAVRDVSTAQAESRSRTMSRSQGRFTRNFVVQGTAAEWALCWMGEIRRRLRAGNERGEPLATHLVFFVHDEVVLHGPCQEAETVRRIVEEAAASAGTLLFGGAPVEFPLTVAQVESYAEAK